MYILQLARNAAVCLSSPTALRHFVPSVMVKVKHCGSLRGIVAGPEGQWVAKPQRTTKAASLRQGATQRPIRHAMKRKWVFI